MNQIYRFQVGEFECIALRDNSRVMPIQQVFPTVSPEELRQAMDVCGFESDEVTVGYNCLYINSGTKHILVDTGFADGELLNSLQAAGISAEMIDTVVITHGDGDHIGGVENFPNARFILTEMALALWTTEGGRAGMIEEFIKLFRGKLPEDELAQWTSNREKYGRDILPALRGRVDLVEPETEFMPGFKLVPAPGHRSDHMAIEIKSGNEALLHVVDGIRHPVQVLNPEWASFIDSHPAQTVETNKMLLRRASQNNATIFGAHLTFPGLMRVRQAKTGWAWEKIT